MQWYLVTPTYKKTGELKHEYREGYINLTTGRSVKFVDQDDEKYIRYASLRDEILGYPSDLRGYDEFDDEVGYLFICGESLRKLLEQLQDVGQSLHFEFLSDDKLTEKPLIRCELAEAPEIVWPSYNGGNPVARATLLIVSGRNQYIINLKIAGLVLTAMEIKNTPSSSGVGFIKTPQEPKKENKIMNLGTNLFKDLYFGKAPSQFALSFNNQITYNGKYYADGAVNDACGLTLDFEGLLYIMPTQELKAGDIVAKKGDAFYFDGKNYISLTTGQKAEYVPTKVLGMTFYSVVKNLAGNMFGTADSKTNPMANMLPFLLLGKDNDSDDLVKFMLLSQGGFNFLQPQAAPEKK